MPRKISHPIPTESQEQSAFVSDVRYEYRNESTFIDVLFFSTLNGAWLGGRSYAMWNKHKQEGAVRGVADVLFLIPRGEFTFMAIEMKRSDRRNQKDGGLTPDEKDWLDTARKNGAYAVVAYSAEDAKQKFDWYMKLQKVGSDGR